MTRDSSADGRTRLERFKSLILAGVVVAVLAAIATYVVPVARHRRENVALGEQWGNLLQRHAAFSGKRPAYPIDVEFSYAPPTDGDLETLRDRYQLQEVAGRGSETDRIINLMIWVYRLTGHANEPEIPKELNALNLIPLARDKHILINCYLKTVILNEVYLAVGFESRQTHLLPHSKEDEESHFITSVFSRDLGRWLLMDPDFGAYVTDEKGAILGVAEIRRRLIAGGPLVVKEVDAPRNMLAGAWSECRTFIDGTSYLWYLKKNMFKFRCPQVSQFNQAADPARVYFELIPDGYREELLQTPRITPRGRKVVGLNDEGLFWQRPPDRAPSSFEDRVSSRHSRQEESR